jgi:hypothetical protein
VVQTAVVSVGVSIPGADVAAAVPVPIDFDLAVVVPVPVHAVPDDDVYHPVDCDESVVQTAVVLVGVLIAGADVASAVPVPLDFDLAEVVLVPVDAVPHYDVYPPVDRDESVVQAAVVLVGVLIAVADVAAAAPIPIDFDLAEVAPVPIDADYEEALVLDQAARLSSLQANLQLAASVPIPIVGV